MVEAFNGGDGECGIIRGEPENGTGVRVGIFQKTSPVVRESHGPGVGKSDNVLSFHCRNRGAYMVI